MYIDPQMLLRYTRKSWLIYGTYKVFTNLTLPYCCACPKLLSTYVMDFLVFNDFRRKLLVSFLYWWNCLTHDDNKPLHNTWDKHRKLSIKLKQNLCCFKTVYWGLSPHFQQYFSYIVAVSFIGGGNRWKPPTSRKSLTYDHDHDGP
jgi:hypothetical protein